MSFHGKWWWWWKQICFRKLVNFRDLTLEVLQLRMHTLQCQWWNYHAALKESVGRKRNLKRWPDDCACLDEKFRGSANIWVHHLGIINICSKIVFQSIWWMLEYFLESDKFDLLVALDEKSVDRSFYGSSSGDLECYCMKFNDSPSNSRDVSVAWKKKKCNHFASSA